MSYQLRRINPFWHTHPMIPTAVVIGGICGAMGFALQKTVLAGAGALIAALAIFMAAKPVVSALLGTLGFFGGLVTFVIAPNLNTMAMSTPMRAVSVALFSLFYMVLMDALVLVVAVIYNLFAGVVGMGGIRLELDTVEEEPAS